MQVFVVLAVTLVRGHSRVVPGTVEEEGTEADPEAPTYNLVEVEVRLLAAAGL